MGLQILFVCAGLTATPLIVTQTTIKQRWSITLGKKQFYKHLHGAEPGIPCSSLTRHTYISQERYGFGRPRAIFSLSLVRNTCTTIHEKRGETPQGGKRETRRAIRPCRLDTIGHAQCDVSLAGGAWRAGDGLRKTRRRVRTLRTLAIRDDVPQSVDVFDEAWPARLASLVR